MRDMISEVPKAGHGAPKVNNTTTVFRCRIARWYNQKDRKPANFN